MLASFACLMITSVAVSQPAAEPASTGNASPPSAADQPDLEASEESASSNRRVGGDLDITFTHDAGVYRCGNSLIDTPLPDGYAPPTPPGAIEIKRYPALRRAEISGETNPDFGSWAGFYPLFQHIKERGIAMTSPVEMDYVEWSRSRADAPPMPGEWTMSFLYRTPELGPTGSDGPIEVVDTQPMTVLSIGIRGPYGLAITREGLARLEKWLAEQDQWERAGEVRTLHYNGPSVPSVRKWSEVQVPVRPTSKQTEHEPEEAQPG